ncbi:NADH-quinone oxidoreductase subunit N [Sulfurovum sp. NBC37-1]|uniref:NADH-quinone oxidoreductase subunit N n=1 Tax=Sulfurovum sp. (strain NBC37-1) TaxID=387093 RepID=UPI0001587564|nr:NADH-quinone oxidoreductase subunit N [Sulfurovum sp. NBC37-1]BAF71811.1 NADH-quinone oxidoreductase, chain N [Sulfurovum sp. NBC37-1]
MISAFSILFAASLLSLLLHRTKFLQPFALTALIAGLVLSGTSVGLNGFETSAAMTLFTVVMLIVLIAFVLHEKNDTTITQALFLATASVALLQSRTMLAFIVSFEAVSLISIVLVSDIRTKAQAEGAVKMFIAGAIATGMLLLGAAFYLMGGGVLDAPVTSNGNLFSLAGIYVMLFAVFYKLTIVPMHGWAADTYALVRHSHAALLTGVAKTIVALAAFRLFAPSLAQTVEMSVPLLAILAVVTMTLGNFMALYQKKLARMLAYSSIAHAGYMLLAYVAVKSGYASTGLLYMAIAYIFMQTAVFLVLDTLRNKYGMQTLEDVKGLAKGNGVLAFFFTVQLFSLAGIPLLAGFLGKAVVFYAVVDAGLWYVALIALLNSALSVGYYAWIVKHLYFDEAEASVIFKAEEKFTVMSQLILFGGTLYFGIFAFVVFAVGKSF